MNKKIASVAPFTNLSLRSNNHTVSRLKILEIKLCGLGSRVRDMEADLIYW